MIDHCCSGTGNKRQKSAGGPIDVDSDDILIDIDVLDILVTSANTSCKDMNRDINKFFRETTSKTGNDGKVHKFRKCTCFR